MPLVLVLERASREVVQAKDERVMLKLRPYQQQAVTALLPLLRKKRRVVAVSPTGSGKTVIGVSVLLALPKKTRVLWLAHRRELLTQTLSALGGQGAASDVGVWTGTEVENVHARILVGSVQTLRTKVKQLAPFDLLVVDEAHRTNAASYQTLLEAWPKAMVLGLTATPCRLDGRGLADTYAAMYEVASQSQLLEGRWIAEVLAYGPEDTLIKQHLRGLSTSGGDYPSGKLGERMTRGKGLIGNLLQDYKKNGRGEAALVFTASRAHGLHVADRFRRSKIFGKKLRVGYVDGQTPAVDREKTVSDFREGHLDILVNVDVFTEGFDCQAKCIIDACPTKSITRYLQRVGRGVRPGKGTQRGKPCIYLDHAGNMEDHRHPQIDRTWDLQGREVSPAGIDIAQVRTCSFCRFKAMREPGEDHCPACGEMYRSVRVMLEDQQHAALVLRTKEAAEWALLQEMTAKLAKSAKQDATWARQLAEKVKRA